MSALASIKTSFRRAIQFLSAKSQYRSVYENVFGIGPMDWHIKTLQCSLAGHLRSLAASNPLRLHRRLSSDPNYILSLCYAFPLYLQQCVAARMWQGEHQFNPKLWHRKRLQTLLETRHGALDRYIDRHCRAPNLADFAISQSTHIAKPALLWRANIAFIGRTCATCLQAFTRAHLNQCPILLTNPIYVYVSESPTFIFASQTLRRIPNHPATLTPLVHLLNQRKYDAFLSVFCAIRDGMMPLSVQ
jgi:hypothetical protein